MFGRFKKFINANELLKSSEKLLVAFSGGVDSVVLAYLLHKAGFHIELAHCNFKLRGRESDGDEVFCRELAKKMKWPIHVKRFDTAAFAKKKKLSLQMAARQLRYEWFSELRSENDVDLIATAHHASDNVETLLINLVRGTGIQGLTGIPSKQNYMVRPLLFATKDEIIAFARSSKLKYRNDSSNDEVKYKRNFLRHAVIPQLKKLNPSLEETFSNNMALFGQAAAIVRDYVESRRAALVKQTGDDLSIDLKKLLADPHRHLLLHDLLYPLGFNASQTEAIHHALENTPTGKLFFSPTHRAVTDRGKLLVSPLKDDETPELTIHTPGEFDALPFTVLHSVGSDTAISNDLHTAQLDLDKLTFPLTLRRWRAGDKFRPLGMKGFKKLSDFFVSQKLDRFEKERVWLLCSNGSIAWVMGYRIDDRFKIDKDTEKVLTLKFVP